MQIAVNCKQHQASQYGAFHEAFIHIGMYSGHCRWSDDASFRTKLSCAPRRLHVIRDGYISFTHTPANFSSPHTILTLPMCFVTTCMHGIFFCLASRGYGVLIFVFRCYFCTPGRGVWRSRELQRGGYLDSRRLLCFGEKSTLYSRPSRRT
jgi:hypothetical protein